jgi:hypothetical protein
MPAFWVTINPTDLQSPLVLNLAGVELPLDGLSEDIQRIRHHTATMNPAAVAQFFYTVCSGIFEALLQANSGECGILGHISNYFGVVETNGRGMLHLHCLVWLTGNIGFHDLRTRLQDDAEFAARMINYLQAIIKTSIDMAIDGVDPQDERPVPPSARDADSDGSFVYSLLSDANSVASKRQMHSKTHTRTCFKYSKGQSRECRFLFPRPLVPEAHVDCHGVIHLERNNQWVNPWNPTLTSLLRSNHDIQFIPTGAKALAAVYYITNYATKYEVSQYQLITTAAVVKRALEEAESTVDPTIEQQRIRRQGLDKFALRAFNRLSGDQEISGPQAASYILDLPDYYTLPTQVRRLNLYQFRSRFKYIAGLAPGTFTHEDEVARFTGADGRPCNILDHYQFRGPLLLSFCLYEYAKLVTIKRKSLATSEDIPFTPDHPNSERQIQNYSEKTSINTYLVAFIGSLSENQPLEDRIRGGHPETVAMQNDLAEILLALLVPWQLLPPLFLRLQCSLDSYKDHCAGIWLQIKPTLPNHLQDVAQNIELLRKSKEDATIDAILRHNARQSALSRLHDNSESEDDNGEETDLLVGTEPSADGPIDMETLYQAVSILKRQWAHSDLEEAEKVPSLLCAYEQDGLNHTLGTHLVPLEHDRMEGTHIPKESAAFYNIGPATLEQWQQRLEASGLRSSPDEIDDDYENNRYEEDDAPWTSGEDINSTNHLIPIITYEPEERSAPQGINRIGPNPTGSQVTQLVQETLPLNRKQCLVVTMILDHAIAHAGWSAINAEDQLLLYVAGEGGTGKTQIIKAIKLGYTYLQREAELLLMAPTGAAAYNIGGRTIHAALGINTYDHPQMKLSSHTMALWKEKSIIIIDEISMVSLTMLSTMNQQCNKIQAVQPDSTAIFGALPIVVFMGDFHQFAPVRAQPLWQTPKNPQSAMGQLLWHRFMKVVVLDEQMRQRDDQGFQALLHRARSGSTTMADMITLNGQVASQLPISNGLDTVCVTRLNRRRHMINRLQIMRFAKAQGQEVYIFPANHTRTQSRHNDLPIDHILGTQDGEGMAKGPGLFYYTAKMPISVLFNVCTPLGLVNGAIGIAEGVVVHPASKLFHHPLIYHFI